MTHRERWTVYPLLFLSLGLAFRDKVAPTFDVGQIRCRGIAVTNAEGEEVLGMQGGPYGGRLEVLDANGRQVAVLGGGGRGAVVARLHAETIACRNLAATTAAGKRVVELGAAGDRAGLLRLLDAQTDMPLVELGQGEHGGVILKYNEIGFPIRLQPETGLGDPDR